MRLTIIGTGYVGLVAGACFSDVGHDVVCLDIDENKISLLNEGHIPIYEPGLEKIVHRNQKNSRLLFSTDIAAGVDHGEVIFIAVGTPPNEDGSADLSHVLDAAAMIARHMQSEKIIVNKSTVPIGSAEKVYEVISTTLADRNARINFDVVSNPEFLKEGGAVIDFMKPDRIIIGANKQHSTDVMHRVYAPFNRNHDRVLTMSVRAAEFTKYAANAYLATRISFMNEMANIAELCGVDIEQVRNGIGSDSRIGYQYIYPGCGYGGSCFPKDVKSLIFTAKNLNYFPSLLCASEEINAVQKKIIFNKILKHFDGDLTNKTISIWGLSFKPKTDDIREAPSRELIESLLNENVRIQAHDPIAKSEISNVYGHDSGLILYDNSYDALEGSDALAIMTEWNVYRSPDFDKVKELLKTAIIFDGRNLYDPDYLASLGIMYYGIARGLSIENKDNV